MGGQDGHRIVAGMAENGGMHAPGAQPDSPEVKTENARRQALGYVEMDGAKKKGTQDQSHGGSELRSYTPKQEPSKEEFFGDSR